jgi:hypothetical protein
MRAKSCVAAGRALTGLALTLILLSVFGMAVEAAAGPFAGKELTVLLLQSNKAPQVLSVKVDLTGSFSANHWNDLNLTVSDTSPTTANIVIGYPGGIGSIVPPKPVRITFTTVTASIPSFQAVTLVGSPGWDSQTSKLSSSKMAGFDFANSYNQGQLSPGSVTLSVTTNRPSLTVMNSIWAQLIGLLIAIGLLLLSWHWLSSRKKRHA